MPVTEVECFTAADNYVEVCTSSRVHLLRSPLTEIAHRLDPVQFVRVHRSHIVAVNHIRALHARPHGEYGIGLASGRQVRSSRAHREIVRSLMPYLATSPDS